MNRAFFRYRVKFDSFNKAAQCGLYCFLLAGINAGAQIFEHQAQQAANFIWRNGFGFDGQGSTLPQLGQILYQCGPLGFRLADAAFVGVAKWFFSFGNQVDQFPDFIVESGQFLFHAGDLPTVHWIIDQCLHRRCYAAHNRI